MSDPVTNAEVEDVLSSIRRLVSEDKRPLQTKTKPVQSDRLVLTPALRVADAETSPRQTDAAPQAAQDWSDEDAAFEAAYGEGAADTPADDPVRAATAEPEPADEKVFSDFIQQMEQDDPALDYDGDPYNFSDDSDEDGEGGFEMNSDTALFDAETPEADGEAGSAEQDRGPEGAADVSHDAQADTLSAKIAALETAIGKIPETWEPDGSGEGDYSGTDAPAMEWEDDAESSATTARLHNLPRNHPAEAEAASFFRDRDADRTAPQAPRQDNGGTAPEEERLALSDDDQVLDEEALRDLVSEIVRAELQGALGERITRNVRKLVRREIHRALTAQELE
ncbi:hypothetical protein FIU94_10180 [Sulfitobacter sp. THAF37]|uniref:hypothetical protein n=1 Tax=Sulfitobacter sp. THAF37 TaxID=2587855 RepID=UPI00126941A0|nr:hypothetical protein [Sulfitobacter sp. THAF37]QFT59192.1 hypothetical protein FIU94_10180 [Sulfitobacter sp. THAF37]